MTANLDDDTAKELDALLITFDDFVSYRDRVACFERGELLTRIKSLLCNFD